MWAFSSSSLLRSRLTTSLSAFPGAPASGSSSLTKPTSRRPTLTCLVCRQLKRHGKQVVLDTSRDALRDSVLAGPTIVKPNVDELQHLTGQSLTGEVALEQAARQLLDGSIQLVVVSMGERGALFVDPAATLVALPPAVPVKSTVGAGDAMVAGLITGKVRGLNLSDCARLATAFSLGAITSAGHNLPAPETIQAYFQQVTVYLLADIPRSASS